MKQRQEILSRILIDRFSNATKHITCAIEIKDLIRAGLMNEVDRTYRRLGGVLNDPPLSFGKWDIILDNFIVELDEEQHFNRYRLVTLDSYIYHLEKGFDILDYTKYCIDYECNCLKKASWGRYWTSPSTEKQFGLPGINRDLTLNGSPRWRQRAFYDYLRDIYAMIYRIPVIRISIYDKVIFDDKVESVDIILSEGNTLDLNGFTKFIEQKVNSIL